MIDLRPSFEHTHWRAMPHSHGELVASDFVDYPEGHSVFGLYKNCGFWTMQEADILQQCAAAFPGLWLDIGFHTGWTAAQVAAASPKSLVVGIDPMLAVSEFRTRAEYNIRRFYSDYPTAGAIILRPVTANAYFDSVTYLRLTGAVIDGDHEPPCPLMDAQNACRWLDNCGVVLLHDAQGKPVQDAAMYLVQQGFYCKVYLTPHVVAVCWRGEEFRAPDIALNPRIASIMRPYVGELERFCGR